MVSTFIYLSEKEINIPCRIALKDLWKHFVGYFGSFFELLRKFLALGYYIPRSYSYTPAHTVCAWVASLQMFKWMKVNKQPTWKYYGSIHKYGIPFERGMNHCLPPILFPFSTFYKKSLLLVCCIWDGKYYSVTTRYYHYYLIYTFCILISLIYLLLEGMQIERSCHSLGT